ncbi:MAG: UvrD-helicase domain-containing protein, partial [Acidobacteriota bacterium]
MRLSSDQQTAVQTRASLAVTAGAGTGKTHLLAERYLFHVVEEQLSPLEVVAITFTRRAAGELRARIRHQVTTRLPGEEELLAEIDPAPIGTIHSLCARICRDHPQEAGLPADFAILDEIGARLANPELIDQALDEMGPEIEAIGEAIPFSLLRELLRRLVSDPVTATQAFTVALGSGGSAERLLEQWADLGRQATELTLRELTAREEWRDAIATLHSQSGGAGDLIENLRREVLDLAADAVNNPGRVAQIGSLQLRGGSVKNWPAGQLETVKSALKVVRDAALKADRRCQNYQISPADHQLALLLPPLHPAFTQVMTRLSLARRRSRLVDYAGLEEGAWRALQVERVRAHYQRRWRAFLVDEFQDTNQIQAEILARLSAQACLTIVGD